MPFGSAQGRLSLRLKNGATRDDANIDVARRNRNCTTADLFDPWKSV